MWLFARDVFSSLPQIHKRDIASFVAGMGLNISNIANTSLRNNKKNIQLSPIFNSLFCVSYRYVQNRNVSLKIYIKFSGNMSYIVLHFPKTAVSSF